MTAPARDGHWIRQRRGTWIIAVPPEVRQVLGVTHRARLYWLLSRKGQAVLCASREFAEGQPPLRRLTRELAAAQAEIQGIRERDARRDRGQYAEGYAHGYLKAYVLLSTPGGVAIEAGERARAYYLAFPEAAKIVYPKQVGPPPAPSKPRLNARTRRARRDARADVAAAATDPQPEAAPSGDAGAVLYEVSATSGQMESRDPREP
jgi:hypothetical protein